MIRRERDAKQAEKEVRYFTKQLKRQPYPSDRVPQNHTFYTTKTGVTIACPEPIKVYWLGEQLARPPLTKEEEKAFFAPLNDVYSNVNSRDQAAWLDAKFGLHRLSATTGRGVTGWGYDSGRQILQKWATPLYHERRPPPEPVSPYKKRMFEAGLAAESEMMGHLTNALDVREIKMGGGALLQKKFFWGYSYLQCTLDGLVVCGSEIIAIEFKLWLSKSLLEDVTKANPFTPEEKKLDERVYKKFGGFWVQVMIQLVVSGLEQAWLVVYDARAKFMVIFVIKKKEEAVKWLKEQLIKRRHVLWEYASLRRKRTPPNPNPKKQRHAVFV
jgi:hypothetical protein